MMKENSPAFEGFVPPTDHYFPMPNEWINLCARITNLAELKIMLYIVRHTWGFHEYGVPKPFTLDEFMQGRRHKDGTRMDAGTGLCKQAVMDGLQRAIADGYLLCKTDESDKGRIKKWYMLKMREIQASDPVPTVDDVDPSGLDSSPQRSTMQTPEVDDVDPSGLKSQSPEVNNADPRGRRCRPQRSKI